MGGTPFGPQSIKNGRRAPTTTAGGWPLELNDPHSHGLLTRTEQGPLETEFGNKTGRKLDYNEGPLAEAVAQFSGGVSFTWRRGRYAWSTHGAVHTVRGRVRLCPLVPSAHSAPTS